MNSAKRVLQVSPDNAFDLHAKTLQLKLVMNIREVMLLASL